MTTGQLTIQDLIDNGSVSATGGDILRDIGRRTQSFLVFSLPRNAGKSTVTEAILLDAPANTPRHDFLGTEAELAALKAQPAAGNGYLVVAEMGHRGRPGYLAAEEVPRVFELVDHGYPLASSLHADDVEQATNVLAQNGVDAETVARTVRYLVKVEPLGDPFDPATRRIVEQIDEVTGTDASGKLTTNRLYRTDVDR